MISGPLRSVLVVSGAAGDQLTQALRSGADAVVADWEDLVPPEDKDAARRLTTEIYGATTGTRPTRLVRVNHPTDGPPHLTDLQVLEHCPIDGVVVPKADLAALDMYAAGGVAVYPLIESAAGVRTAYELAAHECAVALLIGLYDLARSLGVAATPQSLLYPRTKVVVDAKAANRLVIDLPGSPPAEEFPVQARDARAFGFDGKICRTAEQVRLCNEIFA